MLAIAARFSADMSKLKLYMDLLVATFDLAKGNQATFKSKHELAKAARNVHVRARALSLVGLALACEGTYLSACAQFEQLIRDMIEEAAQQTSARIPAFLSLPPKMQEAHTRGCANILGHIEQDKFGHLTAESVVDKLHSCLIRSGAGSAYDLLVDAFSNNERNFRPDILAQHLKSLGVIKAWEVLSDQAPLQLHFGNVSATDTKRFAMERLERIMDKRNMIIHRNKGFAAPSTHDVIECADYFVAISDALANVLIKHITSL